jgi:arylformamidase
MPLSTCPVIIAVGAEETTEFREQSKALYTCWKGPCADMQLLGLPGENHFSVVDAIARPEADLHKAVCRLMNL